MNETMIDPVVELDAVRRDLAEAKAQLAQLQAERDRLKLAHELAGHLAQHVQADAALETAESLARRAVRTSTGRFRVDGAGGGLLADDPAELARMYLSGPGSYLKQTAPLTKAVDGSASGSTTFDPGRISDPAYARTWKEADPDGFKAAWKKHLAEIAARPVGGRV